MSGGKTLTIYYIATEVRDNYVSCVLSFWNNDTITENGLAPLLEKVMRLKNDQSQQWLLNNCLFLSSSDNPSKFFSLVCLCRFNC